MVCQARAVSVRRSGAPSLCWRPVIQGHVTSNLCATLNLTLATEGSFDAVELHLLASGKRDSARLLAQMFVDWAKSGGHSGNFALRGTLPSVLHWILMSKADWRAHRYLASGNILAARTFITEFLKLATPRLLPESPLIHVDNMAREVRLTNDSAVNFCQLAVLTCQHANGSRNTTVRDSWIRLCELYYSKKGVLSTKEVRAVRSAFLSSEGL